MYELRLLQVLFPRRGGLAHLRWAHKIVGGGHLVQIVGRRDMFLRLLSTSTPIEGAVLRLWRSLADIEATRCWHLSLAHRVALAGYGG